MLTYTKHILQGIKYPARLTEVKQELVRAKVVGSMRAADRLANKLFKAEILLKLDGLHRNPYVRLNA